MLLRGVISFLCLCGLVGGTGAANIRAVPLEAGSAMVFVEGEINPDDDVAFRSKVAPYSKGMVILDSIGGSLIAGMEIGRTIRLRDFVTWVPSGYRCASACALAWLGGTRRLMGKNALIGFHAAWRMGDDGPAVSGTANALMGKYLSDLGLSYSAVAYISSASPRSMTWLNMADAVKIGIEVSLLDPEPKGSPNGGPSPQTGATFAATQLRRRTAEYVTALYSAVSGSNAEALRTLSGMYAGTVDYYGKPLSRDELLAQVGRFMDRWPQRHYRPKESSVMIMCDHAIMACDAKGTIEFDARSPARNQHSFGTATFEYTFKYASPAAAPKITREHGAVVERRTQPLLPPALGAEIR